MVVPAAALIIPIIAALLIDEAVAQALEGHRRAGIVEGQHVDDCVAALIDPVIAKTRLDAQQHSVGAERHRDLILCQTPARLEQPGRDGRLQGQAGFVDVGWRTRDARFSAAVRRPHLQRPGDILERLVDQAEAIGFVVGEGGGVGADLDLRLAIQTGGRRTIEKLPIKAEIERIGWMQHFQRVIERDLQALRHEIVDIEFDAAHRAAAGVDQRFGAP